MGPGHGGPAGTAQSYLDGTYTETFPKITKDEAGLQKFFRQFSYPGGIPSHYAPETPGSIHEGGELGYALSHAYGAVMNNPRKSEFVKRSPTEAIEEQNQALADALENATANNANSKEEN